MELAHGVPITEYCDKNKLSAKARFELFIPVCQAIQHAHQKGIIHRDWGGIAATMCWAFLSTTVTVTGARASPREQPQGAGQSRLSLEAF